jgi:hypothetical protein
MVCASALMLVVSLSLGGCAAARVAFGVTGSDEGHRVDANTIEYHVTHPGLDIVIREDYATNLLPIESVTKSSPSPLRHTITYGTPNKRNVLEIDGKLAKTIILNGLHYGKVWTGRLLVDRGRVSLDGKALEPRNRDGGS